MSAYDLWCILTCTSSRPAPPAPPPPNSTPGPRQPGVRRAARDGARPAGAALLPQVGRGLACGEQARMCSWGLTARIPAHVRQAHCAAAQLAHLLTKDGSQALVLPLPVQPGTCNCGRATHHHAPASPFPLPRPRPPPPRTAPRPPEQSKGPRGGGEVPVGLRQPVDLSHVTCRWGEARTLLIGRPHGLWRPSYSAAAATNASPLRP